VNPRLPTMSYLDLSASYTFRRDFQIRGGINNLFDKDPPIVTNELIAGGAANSYELYDGLGRQLFLAVTAKF
jgi:iron complex outermembrane recepter protein